MLMSKIRDRIYGQYVASSGEASKINSLADFESRRSTLEYVVDSYFPSDKAAVVIDLGCGHGALVHFARQRGYVAVRGVDVSPQQVSLAAHLGIEGVIEGDLSTTLATLPEESVDVIVAFDVIEHFTKSELIDFVDAVRRVLKKGGRWIIHAPNGASPFVGAIRYGDFTHEQTFTRSSLEQLMLASGFSRVQCYECAPRAHGFKSVIRVLAWKLARLAMQFAVTAETGELRGSILTRNLYAVVWK